MNIADTLSHFSTEIAKTLAARQDALIRECITKRLGYGGWTDTNIIPRLRIEQERGCPEKRFLLDDQPLITIWPPVSHTSEEGERSIMNWSVSYRKF